MRSLHFSDNSAFNTSGSIFYLHDKKRDRVTAYEIDEAAQIQMLLPRTLGVVSVSINIYDESGTSVIQRVGSSWIGLADGCDVYNATLDLSELGVGLYFFRVQAVTQFGLLYGYCDENSIRFSREIYGDAFQLSVSDFKYSVPTNKLGGIIYHIFVDRFNRSGKVKAKTGTVLCDDWRTIPEYPAYPGAPLKNNCFYGGTLWGVIDKLEYISSLGVDTIYLSPIFDAASNHKYDTADYMSVDSMFGGDEAFSALIKKAKEFGIGIILDGVFNHTGSDSIYFNKYGSYDSVGAYQSEKSEYYSWYDFQDYPDKYTSWWGIDILPRIHPDKPDCRKYFVGKNGVIAKYASMGIDGFRLDVADELSDDFISEIKAVLNKYNTESVLYGEVWEDASNKIAYDKRKQYYLGAELDGVMNYPVRKGILDFLTGSDPQALRYALGAVTNNAPKRIRDMQMNLLGTHDTLRILTALGGEKPQGRSNEYLSRARMNDLERGIAKRRLRMAYAILATIPGIPAIFYGDEAGLEGYQDPFNRMPYPWGKEDLNLIKYYKKIGEIRRSNDVYKDGDFELMFLDSRLLVFKRIKGDDAFITVVNNSGMSLNVDFDSDASPMISSAARSGNAKFEIPAYTAEIFKTHIDNEMEF